MNLEGTSLLLLPSSYLQVPTYIQLQKGHYSSCSGVQKIGQKGTYNKNWLVVLYCTVWHSEPRKKEGRRRHTTVYLTTVYSGQEEEEEDAV